jgi:serine/threonine protein kinase/tetratricopeptide (TPR) repeat protein
MADSLDKLRKGLASRYQIESEIGRGGMATVYLAEDKKHGRKVAIKVLRAEIAAKSEPERFLREIRIAARLTHPNILPLYDSGELGGRLFYVMPFMGCENLRVRLDRDRRLGADEAIRIARIVAEGLDYAHRQGVVHRDIKPENIMLLEGQPVVADFGIARALTAADTSGQSLTGAGFAVGTPVYMSPEQAGTAGPVDGRSDQYSLACVLFEMLAGRPPFQGANILATLARHATEPAPRIRSEVPEVPPSVEQALLRALAKDPGQRFPTIGDFGRALSSTAVSLISGEASVDNNGPTSIAVLPFVNASPSAENEYFSDGITDELINALSKVGGLTVVSRTSAFAYKGKALDVRTIGAQLGATVVLEGTVRRFGDRLRITAQLISVFDGRLLWSEKYDRRAEDLFQIQDEIAETIVGTLRATLLRDLGQPEPRRYTPSLEAWNLYLKGRYFWNIRTYEGVEEAIRHFEAAIREDPDFALAYTGLADSYALGVDYSEAPVSVGLRRAKEEALKALSLDETLAEAHASLAWVAFIHEWDWETAGREYRRAIELDPRYPSARQWYAWYLIAMGRTAESLTEARQAVGLDPASISIRRSLGWIHYYAREPDAAIDNVRKAIIANPTQHESHYILGQALMMKGNYIQARAAFREAAGSERSHSNALAALGRVAVLEGKVEEARGVLDELYRRTQERYVSPVDFAKLHNQLGDTDEAFQWMDRAMEDRRGWMVYLNVEPALDNLRSDPRFKELLRKMRLDRQ